ncbi:hypothetical protein BC629DRAFT_867764 [Irpex lacteus]|nr:hypothetical protein BC629DRAFT_867764 [Irpex lacteus]
MKSSMPATMISADSSRIATTPRTPLLPFSQDASSTPLSRVPSEGTISDSARSNTSTSYEAIRPHLFQQALIESINGAKFDDTEIYIYSARTRSGTVHKPKHVRARRAFLNAACPKFEREIAPSVRVPGPVARLVLRAG